MTSKHQSSAADSTGLSFLSRFPPRISLDTSLLASVIPLPDHPLISYAVWLPIASINPLDHPKVVEQARRKVIQQNAGLSIVESILPSIHIFGDSIALYLFRITSTDGAVGTRSQLTQLTLTGLHRSEITSFSPAGIFPCSDACAVQDTPCSVCVDQSTSMLSATSVRQLPRRSLRRPFVQFVDSIRERLIVSITESLRNMSPTSSGIPAVRLRNGLLFGSMSFHSEWRTGWDRYSHDQPFTYCELTIHLSQLTGTSATLIVRPWLRLSQYHPLLPSLPISAGTPLILLPHGVPAYFISLYTGPASTLTAQFGEALADLGAGDWKGERLRQSAKSGVEPVYIVAWMPVRNKSDEEKGIVLVWPASLSAGFVAGSPSKHANSRLNNLPSLPAHLQASPPPTENHIPLAFLSARDHSEQELGSSVLQRPSSVSTSSQPPSPSNFAVRSSLDPSARPGLTSTPSSHAVQAFRSLTLQCVPPDLDAVASEVSGFVGAVVREREKERERKRRERQGSGSLTASVPDPTMTMAMSSPPVPYVSEHLAASPMASPAGHNSPPRSLKSRSGSLFSEDGSNPDTSMQDESTGQSFVSVEVKPEHVTEATIQATLPIASTSSAPSNLDTFPAFESGWSQSGSDYLPTTGDYSMDFLGSGLGTVDDLGMDGTFDVFTEDDFDFFNGPTLVGGNSAIAPALPPDKFLGTAFTPSTPTIPTTGAFTRTPLEDGMQLGKGPPSAQSRSSPWPIFHAPESFTPKTDPITSEPHTALKVRQPSNDRLPSTALILDEPISRIPISTHIPRYHNAFDPIPFNETHRESDGKYVGGKFALPSPPSEDDIDVSDVKIASERSPARIVTKFSRSANWKTSYSHATDPRVNMTKKLAGFKRKSVHQGGREPNVSPARFWDPEEWLEVELPFTDDSSESDSEEFWIIDDPLSPDPRPVTPPPSHSPLGPVLLRTYFHHAFLQQYTVALNIPGSVPHNTTTTPAAISAPTPISPAAILGSSSEKTRSLEAASQILLREAVENPCWAEAWRASAAARTSRQPPQNVRPVDLKRVAHLLDGVESLSCPVGLDVLLEPTSGDASNTLRSIGSPLLTVGKAGQILNILPSALRFWEKLGLSPRSGVKNVTAFFIFDHTTGPGDSEIGNLLDRLSFAYNLKQYGTHNSGLAPGCSQDGVVPIRFETFRKSLSSFVSGLPPFSSNIVIYILTPDYILHLTSPVLRQVLSAIKRINKTRQSSSPILFHFVPEQLLAPTAASTKTEYSSIEALVDSVYDRIRIPMTRHVSCRYPSSTEESCALQQCPAFTLARPLQPTVVFAKQESVDVLDVLDRYTLLHIGFQVSHGGKWLLASCTDQHGEIHDLKAWLMPNDDTVDSFVVSKVWAFAMTMLAKANLEWIVVVSKRGPISAAEASAWSSYFDTFLRPESAAPIHVLLMSMDQNNPWYIFAQPNDNDGSPGATRGAKSTINVALEVSSATFALHSIRPTPIPQRTREGVTVDQLALSDSDESPSLDELGVLPIATSTLIHVPSEMDYASISMLHLYFLYLSQSSRSTTKFSIGDMQQMITKNLYELKVLASARWGPLGSHNLPLHIAALETMFTTLDESDGNAFVD